MSEWERRAFCPCGNDFEAWRGKMFFVNAACCPKCGASKCDFEMKTARWVPAERTKAWPFGKITIPAHWEFRP